MAHLKIEMNRGMGWEVRSEGDTDATVAQVCEALPAYAVSYPHRATLDDEIVGAALPGGITLFLDETAQWPILRCSASKSALSRRIVNFCHLMAGELGAGVEFKACEAR